MRNTGITSMIANSKAGIGGGFLAFIAGTLMLISNERDFKMTGDTIKEAESVVVNIEDVNTIDTALEGKLAYGVSTMQTDEIVEDELFGVAVNAIKLIRSVEFYQWVEKEHREARKDSNGNSETIVTYTYEKKWVDAPVNSSKFNNSRYRSLNWVIMQIDSMTKWADIVNWGAYKLPHFLKTKAIGQKPVTIKLSKENATRLELLLAKGASSHTASALIKAETTESDYVHHINVNTLHLGSDPSTPAIGDIRVEINHIPPGGSLSVIAQIQGNTFTEYIARNGKVFYSVNNGVDSKEKMLLDEHSNNSTNTWAMRIACILLVIFGIRLTLKPIGHLFSRIRFLSNIVNVGVKFVSTMLGLAWSLIVIALAWLYYRPVTALIIFAFVAAIILLLKKTGDKRVN